MTRMIPLAPTTVITKESVNKYEWRLLESLSPEQLDTLNDIVLKMCKQENEKCVEVVMFHKRFYTNKLEEIAQTIRERYE